MGYKSIQPKVALITGGSSGIGLAASCLFASSGYRVAICGRDQQKLEAAVDTIRQSMPNGQSQHGTTASSRSESSPSEFSPSEFSWDNAYASMDREIMALAVDLNDPEQAIRFAHRAIAHFGQVDVLVNNAAIAPLANFEQISASDFEATINTNHRSLFYLTQVVWAAMKIRSQQREPEQIVGTIVNISSMAAVDPFAGFSLYGASKAWLELLTHALAIEGSESGIRVCAVRPGAVETPLLRGLFPDFPSDQCVSPANVAQLVWRCVSEPNEFPSGQTFAIAR